ncbi:MAG: glycosyltransferase family 4 protein [Gemmatimonadaceae bacterium]|nr:glycosyltransferase family 4 protein [Gemmatimonadaceae bacterium]
MRARPIRILRVARPTTLVTAAVFEELFAEHLGAEFVLQRAALDAWCNGVFAGGAHAPLAPAAVRAFAAATQGVDFLCPSYEAVALLPLLAELRNAGAPHVSLLVIAHSPASWPLEWALLSGLLSAGDRIIAPSGSARDVILLMAPTLAPFVRVIPHPVAGRPVSPARRVLRGPPRLVSLARLTPAKLLHRQLDAMALLRTRGGPMPVLDVAGEVTDAGGRTLPYVRSLQARAERLGIGEALQFTGVIRGDAARDAFLDGASALVNLSVTLEESFGKAPAEALAAGCPALVTRWNGLPETVRDAGAVVPVVLAGEALATVDVQDATLASVLEQLLSAPPSPATIRAAAACFAPSVVRRRYREVLSDALDERAGGMPGVGAPRDGTDCGRVLSAGLLASAPLSQFTWSALRQLSHDGAPAVLRRVGMTAGAPDGTAMHAEPDIDRLRAVLTLSTRVPLEHFFAGIRLGDDPETPVPAEPPVATATFRSRLAAAAESPGQWRPRIACLFELLGQEGPAALEMLARALPALRAEGLDNIATRYLTVEWRVGTGDVDGALAECLSQFGRLIPGESGAPRLHQLARVARAARSNATAVELLEAWLARFPDAPDAGGVWLELALLCCADDHATASRAVNHASRLLGEVPAVSAVLRRLAIGVATHHRAAVASTPVPRTAQAAPC